MIRKFAFSIGGNPIYFRTGTSDGEVFNDMLVREEYDCTGDDVLDPRLIVDCGAYAGYSTLFFLERYKRAHVIAIEPDPGNFEALPPQFGTVFESRQDLERRSLVRRARSRLTPGRTCRRPRLGHDGGGDQNGRNA